MRWPALAAIPLVGCASLIGASFDDAHPAPTDAEVDVVDAHETLPDVSIEVPPPFVPTSLPGLAFWIDATQGVDVDGTNAVTVWHDLSANHYDAIPPNQATRAPKLVAAALGGKPVVHFTAADPDLLQTSWSGPGVANLSIFVVVRGYATSALRFQSTFGAIPYLIFPIDLAANAASPSFWLDVGDTQAHSADLFTYFDGGASVLETTWSTTVAATAATFLDGKLIEQRIVDPALPPASTLFIGGSLPATGFQASFTDGDVAEAIVYTSALDESARNAVEGYLLDKWAIAP
ncbi:MAG TPA: hypothetical protein VGH28_31085 [Polyangiaceae bacterium]